MEMRKTLGAMLLAAVFTAASADAETLMGFLRRGQADGLYLNVSGDTMSGLLTVSAANGIAFPGSTSGTATVKAPAVAGTTAVTLPNASSTLPIFGQQITFAGPTAPRSYVLPDVAATIGTTDTAQTITAAKTFSVAPLVNSATIGAFTTVAHNAGDYTASAGTWTVDAADLVSLKWSLVNKQMTVVFDIQNTDVSATPNFLQILIPGGYTAATTVYCGCILQRDNAATEAGGVIQVTAGDTKIYLYEFGSVWQTTAADNTRVRGQITFEVQ
jgi:hypothetical protein